MANCCPSYEYLPLEGAKTPHSARDRKAAGREDRNCVSSNAIRFDVNSIVRVANFLHQGTSGYNSQPGTVAEDGNATFLPGRLTQAPLKIRKAGLDGAKYQPPTINCRNLTRAPLLSLCAGQSGVVGHKKLCSNR
eukprot:167188-Rhodomonas_salina.2